MHVGIRETEWELYTFIYWSKLDRIPKISKNKDKIEGKVNLFTEKRMPALNSATLLSTFKWADELNPDPFCNQQKEKTTIKIFIPFGSFSFLFTTLGLPLGFLSQPLSVGSKWNTKLKRRIAKYHFALIQKTKSITKWDLLFCMVSCWGITVNSDSCTLPEESSYKLLVSIPNSHMVFHCLKLVNCFYFIWWWFYRWI